eukprot:CAMPEP_0176066770 /NCGR_PEP_ID=MMETSP0120_2-20121206/33323_1 /TAXON_ID=160619 /ORGANISM="Kryptoperidinium foliaceum, Strain CCMP 1326" /LENGTH=329 /DNA_ID=CAMNT_0017400379 /DNA_START=27 /DNA_END=1016 /DNA_ORIENTATION=+
MARGLALLWLSALAHGSGAQYERKQRRPQYARVGGDDGVETLWQRPAADPPRGILFVAHGCGHQGPDLFTEVGPDGFEFPGCKRSYLGKCLGLPEEMRLRKAGLARGYIVMAVSGGFGRKSCWMPGEDLGNVAMAVEHVRKTEGLPEDTPVLAMGASSGGAFVGHLAQPLEQGGLPHLKCIVPEIMAIDANSNRGVPTLFVHMPRDKSTAAAVERDMQVLRSKGIRSKEIPVRPVPVTEEFLAQCFDKATAADVLRAMQADKLLDHQGLLAEDARRRVWVKTVRTAIAGRSSDTLEADESCMAELLNVAWAQHEFTSQFAEEMLDFCEQ